MDSERIFVQFQLSRKIVNDQARFLLDSENLSLLLNSMSSKWDQNVVRTLVSYNKTNAEIQKIGISSRNISGKVKFVVDVASRISDRKQDARKLVLDVGMVKSYDAWKDLQTLRQRKTDEHGQIHN